MHPGNVEIYERCSPLKSLLGESRTSLPLASIAPFLPATIKSLFVLIALGYQVHVLPRDTEANIRTQAGSAIAFWVCQVVRALNEDIADEITRTSDGTLTGILMLLFADVSGKEVLVSTTYLSRLYYSPGCVRREDDGKDELATRDQEHMLIPMPRMQQQIQPSTRWRFHYSGLMKIAHLRGGVEDLWRERPHLQSGILTWLM